MTLEEAQRNLPHGFSGAKIRKVTFDAKERCMWLELAVHLGTIMERPAAEDIYRAGTLSFQGVDRFSADKLHGKALPIEWLVRSIEIVHDDSGELLLYRYTLHLGFKEQLVIVAEQASFDWTGS